jgi:SAM-dependent methyltransferase
MLAWKRRLILLNEGAAEVVGVDISENLLAAAQRKSTALNAAATWVLSDILDAPHNLDGTADLVYTGKGAIAWMMDLEAWARVVARLLKSGGKFFIYDGHPLDWVWADNAETYILDEKHADYFSTNPRTSLFAAKTDSLPHFRQWTLAQTINSLINAGLIIERVEEYPEHFWGIHPHISENLSACLPHTFAIVARKPTEPSR